MEGYIMAFRITKSISSDFPGGISPSKLHKEISTDVTIATKLLGVTSHNDDCYVDFDIEPPQGEKDNLDTLVTGYSHSEGTIVTDADCYEVTTTIKGRVTRIEFWADDTKQFLKQESDMTYQGRRLKTIITKDYDKFGFLYETTTE